MPRPKELFKPKSLNLRIENTVYETLLNLQANPKVQAAVLARLPEIRTSLAGGEPLKPTISQGDVVSYLILVAQDNAE